MLAMPSSTRRFRARARSEVPGTRGRDFPCPVTLRMLRREPGLHQVVAHRLGATLGELLVVLLRPDVVGVSVDGDRVVLRRHQDARDAAQQLAILGPQLGLVELELQVVAPEVHDQAERGAPRLRDLAEGLLQAVDLGLRLLSNAVRLDLSLSGHVDGARGLAAGRSGLLTGERRLCFRLLPSRGRHPGRGLGRGRSLHAPAETGLLLHPSWRRGSPAAVRPRPSAAGPRGRRSPGSRAARGREGRGGR